MSLSSAPRSECLKTTHFFGKNTTMFVRVMSATFACSNPKRKLDENGKSAFQMVKRFGCYEKWLVETSFVKDGPKYPIFA